MKQTILDISLMKPFLEESCNEMLRTYMRNLWEDPADYKVMMARRMLNLNDVLMREWDVRGKEQYLTDGIMSNTAFLLSAKSVADRYSYRRRFPRILVCDDIMLHGRGIIKMIENFKSIVFRRLEEISADLNRKQVELDLYNSISIYIFARNKDEGLLIDENKYHLYSSQILPINLLRGLSLQISDYLQNCGTANTSYVLSVKLSRDQVRALPSGRDNNDKGFFKYNGRYQDVYFRERSPRVLETMRLYFPDGQPEHGGVMTSLTIFGDISGDSFDSLCDSTAHFMEQGARYSQISEYLRMDDPELTKPRAQLLSFLYSILSVADYCRQYLDVDAYELYLILVSGDFNKIISNFDKGEVFRDEILSFFKAICLDRSTGSVLWEFLDRAAQDVILDRKTISADSNKVFKYISGPISANRQKVYEDAEDIFYEVGMDAEYDAFRYYRTGVPFNVNRAGFDILSFRQYIQIMNKNRNSWKHSIGCMFGLMDSGLISMNMENMGGLEQGSIRTVLKAGELATYVLPRRFSIFMPSMNIVESHYKKVGRYARDVIGSFIDYLQGHCYMTGAYPDQRDVDLLNTLIEKKALLLYIYSAGQRFHDWDIDLKNERRYMNNRSSDEGNGFTFEEELERKNYYSRLAMKFVDQLARVGESGRRRQLSTIK